MRFRRPRVTIGTLLILIAFAALICGLLAQAIEIRRLRAQMAMQRALYNREPPMMSSRVWRLWKLDPPAPAPTPAPAIDSNATQEVDRVRRWLDALRAQESSEPEGRP